MHDDHKSATGSPKDDDRGGHVSHEDDDGDDDWYPMWDSAPDSIHDDVVGYEPPDEAPPDEAPPDDATPDEAFPDNGDGESLVSFPWPPPRSSATDVLPHDLFGEQSTKTRLGHVADRLTHALEENGYYDCSFYAIPDGFALATKLEQIEDDGACKKGRHRWQLDPQPLSGRFSLARYLKALFKASPGYYRVIVFVVTPRVFQQSDVEVTSSEAIGWFDGGWNRLPSNIGELEFSKEYDCTALIYEFERSADTEEPKIRRPGEIPGRTHLIRSGIWSVLHR